MKIYFWIIHIFGCLAVSINCSRIPRVVGGTPLPAGAWPWLVSLNYKGHHKYLDFQGLRHLCGGALIHVSWVLTAAHCVSFSADSPGLGNHKNWIAVLGEYNRNIPETTEQNIEVEQIFVKNYTVFPRLSEDIALMKLRTPARISKSVMPVSLDTARKILPGTSCKAAGWGQHTPAEYGDPQYGNGTIISHVADVQLVVPEQCRAAYEEMLPLIDERVMCFGSILGQDTCKGDSGGPLICDAPDGRPVLTGIISVGLGCAVKDYPGIYTRVSSYKDWILWILANH